MDYDLVINYRPGLLHIMPDALSRMFTDSYANEKTVWGTVLNVRFIRNFESLSSPSDFLCQQAIDAITPVHVHSQRHRVNEYSRVGEEEREKDERANEKEIDEKPLEQEEYTDLEHTRRMRVRENNK